MVRRAELIGRRFTSRLHDERVSSWLGIWLGVSFAAAFVTGLISHFMQHPPDWLVWPARPVNLYRVTQGVHVISGLATVPLLLAKLWTAYPKLWQWPPIRSLAHAVKRGFIFLLVAGSLFELGTGILNIDYWYPFPFNFPAAHYWTSYILIGALIVHIVNEWDAIRRSVGRPADRSAGDTDGTGGAGGDDTTPVASGLTRRGMFGLVAGASGLVAAVTVGEALSPLARFAVLAPRRPGVGPQRLPVNKTAADARVRSAALDPNWRLVVAGGAARALSLSLGELRGLPMRTLRLPISCVEGWSAEAAWTGVRVRDVIALAGGADPHARIMVESLEPSGRYRTSELDWPHWRDPGTLLAVELNGEPLALDHGYPCRLIAPNRPGVLQTKWLARLVIT
ncbi:MAG TPA: molybdopterin-dependent oxidoreductase [Streptosporangiaceae bacterium]|nr:molybdopterin-dependent oxidoreductase [Streptosporangiaceae bacterium]